MRQWWHKFDALDPTKIGTGQGAQTYGHGAYVAQNPDVGKGYQKSVPYAEMKRKFLEEIPEDAEFDELMDLVAEGHFSPEQERVLKALEADDWLGFDYPSQAISEAYGPYLKNFDPSPELVESVKGLSGHFYEIDVPDEDIAKMLDWDKPLNQQNSDVQKKLKNLVEEMTVDDAINMGFDPFDYGNNQQKAIELAKKAMIGNEATTTNFLNNWAILRGTEAAGEELLNKYGIPGIKYFDQGSRAAEEGTRNMVLFDDLARRAKVLKRNDEAIAQPSVDEFIGKLLED